MSVRLSDGAHWIFALRSSSGQKHFVHVASEFFEKCSVYHVHLMCHRAIEPILAQSGSVRVDIRLEDELVVTSL
jgi:hypothetical protein